MNDLERKNILVDFPTVSVRPALITFVKDAIGEAKTLPLPERIVDGSRGHDIAGDISTALLWQLADGSNERSDGWLNEKDEPILYEMFDISGSLDGTPSQEDKWGKLFQLADRLD